MFAAVITASPAGEALADVAREFSPRVETHGAREVSLDLAGLSRLFASPRALGEELRRALADRDLQARVAIGPTRTTTRLLARVRAGLTVVDETGQLAALAPLPIDAIAALIGDGAGPGRGATGPPAGSRESDLVLTLRRWGIRTLGELAALPPADLSARLGEAGRTWQRLARGEDTGPLVPATPDERFEAAFDLEWPLDAIEPLSFVIGRLLDDLCARLAARHRAAMALAIDLHLVTREVHARRLELPQPMRDARALRTIALLDLESHPAGAGIDRVVVRLEPAPARPVQHALFTRPDPPPEQVATLLARLSAVMGEGRVGSPAVVDAWRPGAFQMRPFRPPRQAECAGFSGTGRQGSEQSVEEPQGRPTAHARSRSGALTRAHFAERPCLPGPMAACAPELRTALRRFRIPVPARVELRARRPVSVSTDRRGLATGRVTACAGPWRTSGAWWEDQKPETRNQKPAMGPWDRDEWDVALSDGAVYRLFRDRESDSWFVEGTYD